jgi:hypothetical protein
LTHGHPPSLDGGGSTVTATSSTNNQSVPSPLLAKELGGTLLGPQLQVNSSSVRGI